MPVGGARRNARKRPAGTRTLTRADRVAAISRAARLIAELNDGQAKCIECVALLERVAGLLHLKAAPVPVAVVVSGPVGGCALGTAVDGLVRLGPDVEIVVSVDSRLWDGAGHLVLFAAQEQLLLDPSLDQVSAATGFPRGAWVTQVTPDELLDGDLGFETDGGCQWVYRVVRDDSGWRTAYNTQYARLGGLARDATRRALELEGFDENLR